MKIIHTILSLKGVLDESRKSGLSIGLVPTMGALHAGHVSLVERCVAENDICVVSIFVNPTQFNDKNDLAKYPRTLEADCLLLEKAGCSIVFVPEVEEMYPEPDLRKFDFGKLEAVMEGEFRPGHFNGVAQIVSKLFAIVEPDRAYFGEKDFQQLAIIKDMVRQLHLSVEIIPCPIVRESDGLAMSSRNTRLILEQREKASKISEVLFKSRSFARRKSVSEMKQFVVSEIDQVPFLKVEYFDIVDATTLQSIENWEDSDSIVGCIAVFCGEIRLIDVIRY